MTTRSFSAPGLVALAVLWLASGGTGCGRPDPPAHRSVVLVVVDTLRADHLSLYGYPKPTSPGLDRWGAESTVFEHVLAPSSWTKPSTASLLSGLDPDRHGAEGNVRVAESVELLAERLRAEGFATAAFSGNPYVSPRFGFGQGFDVFERGGGQAPRDYPDAAWLLDRARAWLTSESGDPGEPFFLYLHLMNVHGPYRAPAEYRERFRGGPRGETLEFQGDLWWSLVRPGESGRPVPTPGQRADLVARYDAAIAYTEEKLTALLDDLREGGRLDRAVVVVTSDHGEELLDHGGVGHRQTLYREVVDVPLVVWVGDDGSGRRIADPVALIDVPATILDLSGVAPEGTPLGDGVSLGPLVRGGESDGGPRELFAWLRGPRNQASLVQRWPFRLLQIDRQEDGRRGVVELYDERADAREAHDLSAQRPELVAELRALAEARPGRDPGAPAPAEVELDPELRRRLEALGYVDD